jgi:hypothetical protein
VVLVPTAWDQAFSGICQARVPAGCEPLVDDPLVGNAVRPPELTRGLR